MAPKLVNGKLVPIAKIAKPKLDPSLKPYYSCKNNKVDCEFYERQTILVFGNRYVVLDKEESDALYYALHLNMLVNYPNDIPRELEAYGLKSTNADSAS